MSNNQTSPKLYHALAEWWFLLSAPAEYEEEANFYYQAMLKLCDEHPQTLLELGSGGGNNASHLKANFQQMTLVDLSPEMLSMSRKLNPECEHLPGDMRTVRLNRQFDCVFVQDAIAYMTTLPDLKQAIETAFVHCKPGGVTLLAPDHLRENFKPSTAHGGHDAEDRGLRYLEWTWDPDPTDTTYIVDYAYLLRSPDGSTRVEQDRHIEGLFSRDEWLNLLKEVGFEAIVVPFDHSELEPNQYELFVAKRPNSVA